MPRFFLVPFLTALASALLMAGSLQAQPPAEEKPARTDLYGDPLPAGAVARLGTVRLRHEYVESAGAAFVGSLVVTPGPSGLRVWDAGTGKRVAHVAGNFDWNLVPAPDGKWLATREDNAIRVRDARTGRVERSWPKERDGEKQIVLLTFSPDGKSLLVGQGGAVAFWDVATGQESRRLQGHTRGVKAARFTTDGKTLVTLGFGENHLAQLYHWDASTGELRKQVETDVLPRNHRLSHDARTLAVIPIAVAPIRLLDTETGKDRCKLEGKEAAGRYWPAFSPDDRLLVTIWTEDARDDAVLSFWDTATGKLARRFAVPKLAATFLDLGPDGRTLLTVGSGPTAYLWDATTGKRLLSQPAHEGSISALTFAPDGHTLVSGDNNGILRLWDATTGQAQKEWRCPCQIAIGLHVLPDGRAIVMGGIDAEIMLQDLQTGQVVRRFADQDQRAPGGSPPHFLRLLNLTEDGRTVTASLTEGAVPTRQVVAWDAATGRVLFRRDDSSGVLANAISKDGRLLAGKPPTRLPTATKGRMPLPEADAIQTIILDTATGRQILTIPQPDGGYFREEFSPDGQTLLRPSFQRKGPSAGPEISVEQIGTHTLRLWELRSGKERLAIPGEKSGWAARYSRTAFALDGRTLATVRGDHVLQLWDVATGRELLRRTGFDAQTYCLTFSPDGKLLATGHTDSTILVWDVAAATHRSLAQTMADAKDLETWWADLAGDDARKAHAAIWSLAARPGQAVPLLCDRLKAAVGASPEKVRALVADLNHEQFDRREAASKQLAELGELAESVLRDALKANPTAEQRRRIDALLDAPKQAPASADLRPLRAVEVLEQTATPDARRLLETLAAGAADARLTQDAKAALARLARLP